MTGSGYWRRWAGTRRQPSDRTGKHTLRNARSACPFLDPTRAPPGNPLAIPPGIPQGTRPRIPQELPWGAHFGATNGAQSRFTGWLRGWRGGKGGGGKPVIIEAPLGRQRTETRELKLSRPFRNLTRRDHLRKARGLPRGGSHGRSQPGDPPGHH